MHCVESVLRRGLGLGKDDPDRLAEDFLALTGDESLARQVMADYTAAELEPALRALLDYCVAITRDPRSGSAAGVDGLRVLGWSDEAIHDAVSRTVYKKTRRHPMVIPVITEI